MFRKRALALLCALGTAAVPGCSSGTDVPRTSASGAAFREIVRQPTELGMAEALATQRCLRAAGFDVPLPVAASGSVQNLPAPISQAAAHARGYGDLVRRGERADADPVGRYAEDLPAADRRRLERAISSGHGGSAEIVTPLGWRFAAPRGGCVAEGRAAVYGSVDNWLTAFYLPQDLNLTAADSYLAPAVRQAADRYRACMAGQGYAVEIPQQAVELAQSWSTAADTRASAAERALAETDARCQARTGVIESWLAEFDRRASRWIRDNEAHLLGAATIVRTSLPRARCIVLHRATSFRDDACVHR